MANAKQIQELKEILLERKELIINNINGSRESIDVLKNSILKKLRVKLSMNIFLLMHQTNLKKFTLKEKFIVLVFTTKLQYFNGIVPQNFHPTTPKKRLILIMNFFIRVQMELEY